MMGVTNREAEQWNRVASDAARRRIRAERTAALERIKAAPPAPANLPVAAKGGDVAKTQGQGRLF